MAYVAVAKLWSPSLGILGRGDLHWPLCSWVALLHTWHIPSAEVPSNPKVQVPKPTLSCKLCCKPMFMGPVSCCGCHFMFLYNYMTYPRFSCGNWSPDPDHWSWSLCLGLCFQNKCPRGHLRGFVQSSLLDGWLSQSTHFLERLWLHLGMLFRFISRGFCLLDQKGRDNLSGEKIQTRVEEGSQD